MNIYFVIKECGINAVNIIFEGSKLKKIHKNYNSLLFLTLDFSLFFIPSILEMRGIVHFQGVCHRSKYNKGK